MDEVRVQEKIAALNGILSSSDGDVRYSYSYNSGIHSLTKTVSGSFTRTVKRSVSLNEVEDYILLLIDVYETVYNVVILG